MELGQQYFDSAVPVLHIRRLLWAVLMCYKQCGLSDHSVVANILSFFSQVD